MQIRMSFVMCGLDPGGMDTRKPSRAIYIKPQIHYLVQFHPFILHILTNSIILSCLKITCHLFINFNLFSINISIILFLLYFIITTII